MAFMDILNSAKIKNDIPRQTKLATLEPTLFSSKLPLIFLTFEGTDLK